MRFSNNRSTSESCLYIISVYYIAYTIADSKQCVIVMLCYVYVMLYGYLYSACHERLFRGALCQVKGKIFKLRRDAGDISLCLRLDADCKPTGNLIYTYYKFNQV